MLLSNLHRYRQDRSSFNIDKTFIGWAEKSVFDNFSLDWCKKNPTNYYTTKGYFPPNPKKFRDQLATIQYLNLINLKEKRILDIGAGVGHFCKVNNVIGNIAEGTELAEVIQSPVQELYKHYNLNIFELHVKPQQEIKLLNEYHFITSIRTWFNFENRPYLKNDWIFFKNNLLEYILPGGGIFIKTNYKFFKSHISSAQKEIILAFGDPLQGWNSFTYYIKK